MASVEVDAPGCSYNPDFEQHQDAVAAAVAAELRKAIDNELQPIAPPRVVDYQPETDELTLLQVHNLLAHGAEMSCCDLIHVCVVLPQHLGNTLNQLPQLHTRHDELCHHRWMMR